MHKNKDPIDKFGGLSRTIRDKIQERFAAEFRKRYEKPDPLSEDLRQLELKLDEPPQKPPRRFLSE